MPCYSPGRSKIGQVVSCGYCLFCRLKYAGEWAVRCTHEASLYSHNCFITLTYDDKRLPEGYDIRQGLVYSHFNIDFMKALRDRCAGLTKVRHHNFGKMNSKTGKLYPEFHRPIRFYMSGEYGETNPITKVKDGGFYRPHFHACLFNFDFSDQYFWRWRRYPNGTRYRVFRSPTLEELWPYGNSEIGSVTFNSAGYVARYILKKINGDKQVDAYRYVDSLTGEVFDRRPVFSEQSVRPGIGEGWLRKFVSDVYPVDHVVLRDGRKVKPPRYYDKLFFKMTKDLWPVVPWADYSQFYGELVEGSPDLDNIKFDRIFAMKQSLDDVDRPSLCSERLNIEHKVSMLKRILD